MLGRRKPRCRQLLANGMIYLDVGKEGVLSFSWFDPATEPVVKQDPDLPAAL